MTTGSKIDHLDHVAIPKWIRSRKNIRSSLLVIEVKERIVKLLDTSGKNETEAIVILDKGN